MCACTAVLPFYVNKFPYNRNEKSLHFPTQAEMKNAIIFSYNIWVQCTIRPPQLPGWWRHWWRLRLKLVVREGRTQNLVMMSQLRHEIQLIKVDCLYVSKGIHFGPQHLALKRDILVYTFHNKDCKIKITWWCRKIKQVYRKHHSMITTCQLFRNQLSQCLLRLVSTFGNKSKHNPFQLSSWLQLTRKKSHQW